MDIKGKKAIVFGGTSGIGLSATQMLSDKGAQVIALSRNPEKIENLPKNVITKINAIDKFFIISFLLYSYQYLDLKGLTCSHYFYQVQ